MNTARPAFPFAAIVGQEEMKLALLLNVIAPAVGGVLIMGERGTGKSTAVRALASLLPPLQVVRGCAYNCDPNGAESLCADCRARLDETARRLPSQNVSVPVVELPLGATEDRVCGTLDVGRALREGERSFEPGLLARANRGFLYIDEVNLLEDHLVDLLLDVAATGVNRVEREGVSLEHPSRFVLVGSGNPEEGELRPQLLDRFGLCAEIKRADSIDERVEIVERCESFERDAAGFVEAFAREQEHLRKRITRARRKFPTVVMTRDCIRKVAEVCQRVGVDGHRGELTLTRAARALAAFEGKSRASEEHVRRVAMLALRHRLRRDPLEQSSGGGSITEALDDVLDQHSAQPADSEVSPDSRAKPDNAGKHDADGDRPGGEPRSAPPTDARLRPDAFTVEKVGKTTTPPSKSPFQTRRRSVADTSNNSSRGRYAGATVSATDNARVAVDATLRASASRQADGSAKGIARALTIGAGDLRYKRLKGRAGTLYVFALDTSGSMALNRIGQAKGVVGQLLRRSYVNRDRVALVCFREGGARLLLRPTSSVERAKRILDALPVGGATPLSAGLLRTLEVVRRVKNEGAQRVVVAVFTDGRGNVPLNNGGGNKRSDARAQIKSEVERLGAELRRARVTSVVVDTGNRFVQSGDGVALADALGGHYVHLPSALGEKFVAETFKA